MVLFRYYLLFSVLLLCAVPADAQRNWFVMDTAQVIREQADYTFIYAIPVDSVPRFVYGTDKITPDASWLQTPARILPADGDMDSLEADPGLSPGYYLSVSAVKDKMQIRIWRKKGFYTRTHFLGRNKILIIEDDRQEPIMDAYVSAGGKVIQYNAAMKGYLLGAILVGERVLVRKGGDMELGYYWIEPDYGHDHYGAVRSRHKHKSGEYNGYLVTNKPMYLPGDTVRFKAYLRRPDRRKKTVSEPVQVRFSGLGRPMMVQAALPPDTPGVYLGEFVLGDSVKIDVQYELQLEGTRSGLRISRPFRVEDYLLDELRLRLVAEQTPYRKDDTIRLSAYAHTMNDLPVSDGRMTLTIQPLYDVGDVRSGLFIPDTLVQITTEINPEGETRFEVPTAGFPALPMQLRCYLSVVNGSGERRDTSFLLSYHHTIPYVRFRQNGPELEASLMSGSTPVPGKGIFSYSVHDVSHEDTISYPFTRHLKGGEHSLRFYQADSAVLQLKGVPYDLPDAALYATEEFRQDTAVLHLSNPYNLDFRYEVYIGQQYAGRGRADKDTLIRIRSPRHHTVTVYGAYQWKGREQKLVLPVYYWQRKLDIQTRMKEIVYPGQEDSVQIVVRDNKGTPVPAVNLTALAFSNQFREDYVPEVPYTGTPDPAFADNAITQNLNLSVIRQVYAGLSEDWLRKCGADTQFYYRHIQLLPDDITWIEYDAPESPQPQLGIFIKEEGVYRQPEIVYVDDRPVYYDKAASTQPNSFFVGEGRHKISLRMHNALYTIDTLWACPGKKLNVFIHADSARPVKMLKKEGKKTVGIWHETHLRTLVRYQKMPDTLQDGEAAKLAQYFLLYGNDPEKRSQPLFFQYPNLFRLKRSSNINLIGPLNFRDSVTFYQEGNVRLRFMPELNYVYTFRPGMMRLERTLVTAQLPKWLYAAASDPDPSFLLPPPDPVDSLSVWPVTAQTIRLNDLPLFTESTPAEKKGVPYGYISLLDRPMERIRLDLVIRGKEDTGFIWIRNNYQEQSVRLPEGQYEILVIQGNDSARLFDGVYVKPYGHTILLADEAPHAGLFAYERLPAWLRPCVILKHISLIPPQKRKSAGGAVYGGAIQCTIRDDRDEPLIAAVVRVEQLGVEKGGAVTDTDGNCIIKPLPPGRYDVRINYTGMKQIRIVGVIVRAGMVVRMRKVMMSGTTLEEVAVISNSVSGFISKEKGREVFYREEIRHMPTRNTSDFSSLNNGIYQRYDGQGIQMGGARSSGGLYIIDGVQVTNSGAITGSRIAATPTRKKPFLATSGAQQFIQSFLDQPMQASGLRKNFRDWAIWEPDLWTDGSGKASFRVAYPDNVTSWRLYVLAMNRKGYGGRVQELVRSFKPLSAQLSVPGFLRYGDTVSVIGKVTNYTGQSFFLHTTFLKDSVQLHLDTLTVGQVRVTPFSVIAPLRNSYDTAKLALTYTMSADNGYTDGEERVLSIYPVGAVKTAGSLVYALRDTVFPGNVPAPSGGVFTGETRILVDGSPVESMIREIEYLKVYPYGCTEQLTSKLLAIHYEERVKQLLHHKEVNNADARKKIIADLVRAQHGDGSFGWWADDRTDYRVTNYVLQTMGKMNGDGALDLLLQRGHAFLQGRLESMQDADLLVSLRTLSDAGYPMPYRAYLSRLDSMLRRAGPYDRLTAVRIRKAQGLPYRSELDSVMKQRRITRNGTYWTSSSRYDWLRDDLPATLLAYELIREDSVYGHLGRDILQYLMFRKGGGYYQNTAASGMVLSAVLPELLKDREPPAANEMNRKTYVRISRSISDSLTTFPAAYTVKNREPTLHFTKKGLAPVYISVVQDFFEKDPQPHTGSFGIRTQFLPDRNDEPADVWQAGRRYVLRVVVTAHMDAEYVMIEIPVPAGAAHTRDRRYYGAAAETHRENFKDRTVIFCRNLPEGAHTFDVPLDARYKGSFVVSPARAAMMYYPEECGNNEVKTVVIQ